MERKHIYNVAVYLRLSRDDGELAGDKVESNSIHSQRNMICSYIRRHDELKIYDVYVDDGWSGVNFDRPGFKRMMADIENGNVDCVIVKDLSRLGRDYIEVGRLVQRTFPAFSVRFIALTDDFDSITADYNEKNLVVPLKNFINDAYCRDISLKVKSHQKVKRENGDFIGAFTIYGYRKSEKNKNRLVVDLYAADVVKKIFAWKIEGYSASAIANRLNRFGVLSPMEYKKIQGEKFCTGFVTGIKTKWSTVAVMRILTNETYTGTLIQGKQEKMNYKINRSVKKPENKWCRVENTHEAIVSIEDFLLTKQLLEIDTRAVKGEEKSHMYAGLLFCGDCLEPMNRRVNRYKERERVYYICAKSNRGKGCTRHSIEEETLNRLVLTTLGQQITLLMDREKVFATIQKMEINFNEIANFNEEVKKLKKEQEKYRFLKTRLYEDLKRNVISEKEYKIFGNIYEKCYVQLEQAILCQKEAVKKFVKAGIVAGVKLESMKRELEITELDRMVLVTFVKRIFVYENKKVYLEMRYKE